MVFSPNLFHAQTALVGSFNRIATPIQPAPPDSIVQVTAEAQGLQLVPSDQVPPYGTFWWAMPSGIVPMPFAQSSGQAVYQIADGQFLVDATGGQSEIGANLTTSILQSASTVSAVTSAMEAQAAALVALITQVHTTAANLQTRATMQAMGMDVPSPGGDGSTNGGDGYSPMFSSGTPIDTNGLWLQITNDDGNFAYLNLCNGTNQVYAIWTTTNLLTSWQVVAEVWPTNGTVIPTVTPFTVPTLNQPNLFVRAEDWTGVTENGNTTPDWWFWMNFGTTALSDTNRDSQGNTLLSDYQYGTDPNIITFSLSVTNFYVNTMSVPVKLNITAGVPSYCAVLVDDTNFADAVWNAYTSSNINVNLGLNAGGHGVWIGLKGFSPTAHQTWQWTHLNLMQPPVLVITNPVSNIVSQPVIQIYGYCQESLASINYDISNAVGVTTGLPSEITDRYYDTNANNFTTGAS
jgi:hypothetical protein